MLKAFKYRIYPTKSQSILLDKHIGSVRFIYNLALETKKAAYNGNKVNLTCFELIKQLPDLKKECPWLLEVNSQSLQQAISHLDEAFNKFFKKQNDFPKFKKKRSKQSFSVPQGVKIDFDKNRLIFPKFINGIKINIDRCFDGEIRQAVITKTPTGKYFASVLVNTNEILPIKRPVKKDSVLGIDLGLKSFLITSEGIKVDNPKFFNRTLSKLKYIQRKLSKHKGQRTYKKLTITHEKIANQRKDFLHKLSTQLINNHDTIAIEDLNIKGMLSNHCLAKSVSDVSWHSFIEMLKYKAEWNGKNLLQIGRFEPSSKTCSCCGNINKELSLKDRDWTCSDCGIILDRDINAAINIKNFALKNLSVGRRRKNQKELPTLVGALTSEA